MLALERGQASELRSALARTTEELRAAASARDLLTSQLREARGWSQQALADVADVSKPTIYRIETARYSVTLDVLVSLAQALELSLAELVSFAPPVTESGR